MPIYTVAYDTTVNSIGRYTGYTGASMKLLNMQDIINVLCYFVCNTNPVNMIREVVPNIAAVIVLHIPYSVH